MAPSPDSSARRLFVVHAAISLVPVVLTGLLIANSSTGAAQQRGLTEARNQASLIAATVIEPALNGRTLRGGLTIPEELEISSVADQTARDGSILRLRLRDLDGRVVYSSDGTGLAGAPDQHAVEAAQGESVAELTQLDFDAADSLATSGAANPGDDAVEVYQVVRSRLDSVPVGVLEVYLPYASIRADVTNSTQRLYRDLAVGLGALYLVLAGLSITTTRRIRRQAAENTHLAEHDHLTGLPNRDAFLTHIAALRAPRDLDQSAGPATFGTVAIVDLDRFKDINDTLGHANGDKLLRGLAERIASVLGPDDVVARLGGDEFGVVLGTSSDGRAHTMLSVLRAAIAEPITITDLPLTIEASIGYALVPDDGVEALTLLQRADIAMYLAKSNGTGIARYSAAQNHFDGDRLALVAELQRALVDDELVLHFQPKLDLRDGSVRAAEALLRWNHPRRGLLQPDTFLPVVEHTGLIDPLTDWVVARTLQQIIAWDAVGLDLAVSLNVSARNFAQPAFASNVLHAVRTSGIKPDRLVLEITETALLTDVDNATVALDYLRSAGLQISIDDFGQGQTSLAILARLPVSELKIDRQFVTPMCHDEVSAAIVRSVIELAHNLGLHVVAEGAEDEGTVELLRSMGCDTVQGYTIARPMPADALARWMGSAVGG